MGDGWHTQEELEIAKRKMLLDDFDSGLFLDETGDFKYTNPDVNAVIRSDDINHLGNASQNQQHDHPETVHGFNTEDLIELQNIKLTDDTPEPTANQALGNCVRSNLPVSQPRNGEQTSHPAHTHKEHKYQANSFRGRGRQTRYPPQQREPETPNRIPPQQREPEVPNRLRPQQRGPEVPNRLPLQQRGPEVPNRLPPQPRGPEVPNRLPPQQQGPVTLNRLPPQQQGPETLNRLPPQQRGPETFNRLSPQQRGPETLNRLPPQQRGPETLNRLPPQQQGPETLNRLPPQQRGPETLTRLPLQQRGPENHNRLPPQQQGPETLNRFPPQQQGPETFNRLPPQQRGSETLNRLPPQQRGPENLRRLPQEFQMPYWSPTEPPPPFNNQYQFPPATLNVNPHLRYGYPQNGAFQNDQIYSRAVNPQNFQRTTRPNAQSFHSRNVFQK